jgi:hypothetical protein
LRSQQNEYRDNLVNVPIFLPQNQNVSYILVFLFEIE